MKVLAFLAAVGVLGCPSTGSLPSLSPTEVDRRVEAWQPTARERAFERIGWAKDIRDALRLAKAHGRPVFLFTHDGRLGIGRC